MTPLVVAKMVQKVVSNEEGVIKKFILAVLQSDIKGCTICNTIIGTKKGTKSFIKSGTKNTSDQNTNVVCGGGYIEK